MQRRTAIAKPVIFWSLFAYAFAASAQTPANGDFEAGLSGWTVGGTAAVAVLLATDFAPNLSATQWPDQLAVLSTGPGNVPGGAGINIDGAGGANDFDTATLSAPISFTGSPRVLRFEWSFPSSEEDQPNQFDDLFVVEVDGDGDLNTTTDRTRMLALSSYKPGGSSPFPDGPENGAGATTITGGPAPPLNTNLRFGVHAKQTFCASIPNAVQALNEMAILIRVADQGDSSFDSAALIDNVVVEGACDATLTQLTTTASQVLVEAKDGQFLATPVSNNGVAMNDDGSVVAFVSTGNLTGDNPSGVSQVVVLSGSTFERVAELSMTISGRIDSVSLSGNGRYLAIAAAPRAEDNLELFRYDRNNNSLTQLTDTSGCENTRPAIDDNGSRIAFESNCASLTGAGNQTKVVLRNGNAGMLAFQGPAGCSGSNPSVTRANNARFVAFESDCDHTGGNPDGNTEIFRYDRTNAQFLQVTDTTDPAGGLRINAGPKLYGANNGQVLVFVSDADLVGSNADHSLEAFRFDAGGGGSMEQLTDESGGLLAPAYVTVHVDTTGEHFALSRLNPLTGTSQIEYRSLSSVPQLIAEGSDIRVPVIGLSGGNAIIAFDSGDNFVTSNADGNVEIWRAVVMP